MRLLTHNMLSSNIKGVPNGFPLRVEVEKVIVKEVDFNPDFLKNIFLKIEWQALTAAALTMGYTELPEEAQPSMLDSDEFLRKFHHALLELHLEEGALVCPVTGRKFPVNKGIPNMLLHEDELEYVVCGEQKHIIELIKTIATAQGLKGFWKLNLVNFPVQLPSKQVNFCAYDAYRKQLLRFSGNEETTNLEGFIAGAAAGVTATILCI